VAILAKQVDYAMKLEHNKYGVQQCNQCSHYFQIGIDGDGIVCDLCMANPVPEDLFPTERDKAVDA
jgi:hypothetical protein